MIILDTNIISELMKPTPERALLAWLDQQDSDTLFITCITVAEIMYGLYALPEGKRRMSLELAFKQVLKEGFAERLHSFDQAAAMQYAMIMSTCKEKGRGMSVCDGQIAAIALAHQSPLATRNTKNFEACGISLINPFLSYS